MSKDKSDFKPTKKYRMLLESEILEAQKSSRNIAEVLEKLGVTRNTYIKYAEMYNLHRSFKQNSKAWRLKNANRGGFHKPIEELMTNSKKNYHVRLFKQRLIFEGYKEKKCECCGYKDYRLNDGLAPLSLCFLDGNKHNWELSNLKMLCYNCTFLASEDILTHIKTAKLTKANIVLAKQLLVSTDYMENPNKSKEILTINDVNILNSLSKAEMEDLQKYKEELRREEEFKKHPDYQKKF